MNVLRESGATLRWSCSQPRGLRPGPDVFRTRDVCLVKQNTRTHLQHQRLVRAPGFQQAGSVLPAESTAPWELKTQLFSDGALNWCLRKHAHGNNASAETAISSRSQKKAKFHWVAPHPVYAAENSAVKKPPTNEDARDRSLWRLNRVNSQVTRTMHQSVQPLR